MKLIRHDDKYHQKYYILFWLICHVLLLLSLVNFLIFLWEFNQFECVYYKHINFIHFISFVKSCYISDH